MKKIFLFAAAIVAAMAVNAADPVVVSVADYANYIDFQALSVSDANMTKATITSEAPYTLANGTVLKGFKKSDNSEAEVKWNVKSKYDTNLPTPNWDGVDSLTVGTMLRAASNASIVLGAFKTSAEGKLVVYYQPNGDSERGVVISVYGEVVTGTDLTGSGAKINGIRPAYAGEITLPVGDYDAGDVVIKLITNTSNIFGVRIEKLQGQGVENVNVNTKAEKFFRDGQLIIRKNGVEYNALGAEL